MRNYLVSLLLCTALVGCKKDNKAPEGGSAAASGSAAGSAAAPGSGAAPAPAPTAKADPVEAEKAPAPAGGGATAPSDAPGLTVLDAGAEPRVQLAYKIAPGTKQAFGLSVDMGMDMGAMGGKMKLPSMTMDGDVAFAEGGADGMNYTLTTKSLKFVDTPGAMVPASAINGKLAGVQNMVATGTLSPSGKVSNFKIDMKDAPPEIQQTLSGLRQSYDQMVTQFPDTPVGKGARWQSVAEIDQNGIKAKQTAVFEVVAIDGSTVTLKNTVTISAPAQQIHTNGVTADLKKMVGTGSADMTLDLTKMIGPSKMVMHIDEELAAMGQSMSMAMDMNMRLDPK